MRKSKWWLGFLDYVNVANFVGPEEFKKKVGDAEFEKMMAEYQKSPQAQKNFADEYGANETSSNITTGSPSVSPSSTGGDSIQQMVTNMFMSKLNPIPGM